MTFRLNSPMSNFVHLRLRASCGKTKFPARFLCPTHSLPPPSSIKQLQYIGCTTGQVNTSVLEVYVQQRVYSLCRRMQQQAAQGNSTLSVIPLPWLDKLLHFLLLRANCWRLFFFSPFPCRPTKLSRHRDRITTTTTIHTHTCTLLCFASGHSYYQNEDYFHASCFVCRQRIKIISIKGYYVQSTQKQAKEEKEPTFGGAEAS